MMRKNRWLATLGTASAAVVAVAGLGSVAGAQTSTASSPITITFWSAYSTTSPEATTLHKVVIPAFEKLYPNIKVNAVELPYDQMQKKLLTSAAGGQLPNLARLDIIWSPQLAKLGVLVSGDSLPGFTKVSAKVFKGPLSTNMYQGKYYGLPLDTNTKVLLYNPAVLAKAGIKQAPKTMFQFLADLQKLSHGTGKDATYGYALGGTDMWNLLPWVWTFGGDVVSPDLTKASGYMNGPKTVAAMQLFARLANSHQMGGFHPGDVSTSDGLEKGTYAMIDDGPWMYPIYKGQYPNFKFGATLWPSGPAGSHEVVGGENIGIFTSDAAHEAAAWKFEQFMLSPTAQVAMAQVGQMPVRTDLANNPAIKKLTYFKTFLQQIKTSKARPVVAAYSQVDDAFSTAMSNVLQGKQSVKQALDAAAAQADQALAGN